MLDNWLSLIVITAVWLISILMSIKSWKDNKNILSELGVNDLEGVKRKSEHLEMARCGLIDLKKKMEAEHYEKQTTLVNMIKGKSNTCECGEEFPWAAKFCRRCGKERYANVNK